MALVLGNPGEIVSQKGSVGYVNNIWTDPPHEGHSPSSGTGGE